MRITGVPGWAAAVLALSPAFGLGCGGWEDRPNSTAEPRVRDATEWPVYGGIDSLQFSPLDQIDRDNVDDLQVAWTYRSGDLTTKDDPSGPTSFQASPIVVDGILYFPTPLSRVIALDPATGAEHWSFDPQIDLTQPYGILASRGVAYWEDRERPAGGPCTKRILFASVDAYLWALDSSTGQLCSDFGDAGRVDLNAGPGEQRNRYEYGVTSPPQEQGEIVWEQPLGRLRDFTPIPLDVGVGMPSLGGPLVTGGGLIFIGAAPGHLLRAFDVDGGEEVWHAALPAGANATPITYEVRGEDGSSRQFVVVAAGGHWAFHRLGDDLSDTLVAFALPEGR